jgi:hypothetical protein
MDFTIVLEDTKKFIDWKLRVEDLIIEHLKTKYKKLELSKQLQETEVKLKELQGKRSLNSFDEVSNENNKRVLSKKIERFTEEIAELKDDGVEEDYAKMKMEEKFLVVRWKEVLRVRHIDLESVETDIPMLNWLHSHNLLCAFYKKPVQSWRLPVLGTVILMCGIIMFNINKKKG